jgi:23S rRNA-/tRNA-specific pseudouridylate synthase
VPDAAVRDLLAPAYANAHRIDFETSGLVVFAKTREGLRHLARQFETKTVEKRYLALVRRAPPEAEMLIDQPITPDLARPGAMRPVRSTSAPDARAPARALARLRWWSLPGHGRQHQIRVHLALVGCPVLVDPLYGTPVRCCSPSWGCQHNPARPSARSWAGSATARRGRDLTTGGPATGPAS